MDAEWPSSFPAKIISGTRTYYVASFLGALSVALPHAVLTPILLSKGLDLSQIALVQIFYSLAVFLFEIPSGIAADVLGRKRVYLCSKLVLVVFGVLVFFASALPLLCLAWFIYGLSSALESGTIGNEVILAVRKVCRHSDLGSEKVLHYLVRVDARCATIGLIIGGLLGSFFYPFIGKALYLWVAASALFVALFVLGVFHLNSDEFEQARTDTVTPSVRILDLFRDTIHDAVVCLKDSAIRRIILVIAVAQIFFQMHFQFWQAYFLAKGINTKYFGIVYVAFQLVSVLVSFLGASLLNRLFSSVTIKVFFGAVVSLSLVAMFMNSGLSILAYFLFVFGFWIVVFYSDAHFRSLASESSLSTLTSVSSAVSRICSMLTLGIAGILLQHFGITILMPVFFLVASVMLLILYLSNRN